MFRFFIFSFFLPSVAAAGVEGSAFPQVNALQQSSGFLGPPEYDLSRGPTSRPTVATLEGDSALLLSRGGEGTTLEEDSAQDVGVGYHDRGRLRHDYNVVHLPEERTLSVLGRLIGRENTRFLEAKALNRSLTCKVAKYLLTSEKFAVLPWSITRPPE
ncbi:unnamed protein product, partial [Amoebophrya sp. A25]|eukprot:GSA25T00021744001.1